MKFAEPEVLFKGGRIGVFHLLQPGGAVAEWSKALQLREKINENQKIPGSPPNWVTFQKNLLQSSEFHGLAHYALKAT